MFDLSGKRIFITGASGGIGAAIARAVHLAGGEVCIGGRNRDRLASLAAGLGDRCHILAGDLADSEAAGQMVERAGAAMGGIDILVNNAGFARDGLVMRMKEDDWHAVLDVNLHAVFRLSRAVLRGMIRAKWGRIINITSIIGHTGNPGQANYAASKAGLAGLTKSLAAEVASRGITVNCIAPGFIRTAMTGQIDESRQQVLLDTIPAGRFGTPEDVAACTLFLASSEASYVTGQTLHVNGGMAMI